MSLTEHEQRLLDQIENGLRGEAHKNEPLSKRRSQAARPIVLVSAAVVCGLVVVFVGLASKIVPVSIIGFLLIVGALMLVTRRPRDLYRAGRARVPRPSQHE
jgi:hypothetical protein